MANDQEKKVTLSLSADLYKRAKAKATLNDTSLDAWVLNLIQAAVDNPQGADLNGFDWGRIDSRIDSRIASLERQLDSFSAALEQFKRDKQPPFCSLHLVEHLVESSPEQVAG